MEELTRGSKQKSGWSSGWKKVTKSFHSKDHHDYTAKILTEQLHKIDTPPPPRRLPSEHTDLPALRTSKSQIVRNLPKTPEAGSTLPLRQESLPNPKPPKADSKPTHEAVIVTPTIPAKNEPIVETQPVKDSSKGEMPSSTSAPPEKDVALDTSADNNLKDRRKDDNVVTNHPRRRQCRSTSPDYVRSRRHHIEWDSVTSTSSYTSTSNSVSSHSGHGRGSRHRRRRRRDYSEDHRGDRSTSRHIDASLDKHHSRHHHSSVHKSDHSGLHSSEHSHQKHRQKEGSEHHSHHSHHSGKEHHSVDSHPRHTSKDHLHPNGHHRASHHSSHRQKVVSNKHSSQHRRQPRHHHKEVFSNSDGSSDSGTRRRHR